MRFRMARLSMRRLVRLLLAASPLLLSAQHSSTTLQNSADLKTFLQRYMNGEATMCYSATFVRLTNRKLPEAVVYFMGPRCGTGGAAP